MNAQDFTKLVDARCASIQTILTSKAKEYASDVDRLHNFKYAGERLRCTPEKALIGMMEKHSVSVIDMVNDCEKYNYSHAYIEEKIGDHINYLVLLEALLKERNKNDRK